jgi:ferrochelatase
MGMKKQGLLILNLGTPDDPGPEAVGRYLREFLMDKWVIDIPWLWRWILVHILIVPRRKHASSLAYKTIWTERGSPLRFNLLALAAKVMEAAPNFNVKSAMRYGQPSIKSALQSYAQSDVEEILVFPLYPQYAESTARSSIEECTRLAKEIWPQVNSGPKIAFVQDYFIHPEFISSYSRELKSHLKSNPVDHVLMSFHGLPERHMKKVDTTGGDHCLRNKTCCETMKLENRLCYRAQSVQTARAISVSSGLSEGRYSVSFQSRLGRTKWIEPYTDIVIPNLAKSGIKNLVVLCPSFTADCLETIEEMGDRGRRLFLEAGGETFTLLPCLNDSEDWVEGLLSIANDSKVDRVRLR